MSKGRAGSEKNRTMKGCFLMIAWWVKLGVQNTFFILIFFLVFPSTLQILYAFGCHGSSSGVEREVFLVLTILTGPKRISYQIVPILLPVAHVQIVHKTFSLPFCIGRSSKNLKIESTEAMAHSELVHDVSPSPHSTKRLTSRSGVRF